MPKYFRIGFLTLLSVSTALAQLDSNSVTVTASRNVSLQGDQAVFAVYVQSRSEVTLNDIVAAVQPAGITMANFAGVGSQQQIILGPQQPASVLEWAFALPVPLAKIKDTVAALTDLQKTIAQKTPGLTLTFSVQGTQPSTQAQQALNCSTADLMSDARAQAQKLADAAGMNLGSVLAMSGITVSNPGAINAPVGRWSSAGSTSFYPPVCTLTVKFGLGRN